jgi:hypothetical protein
LSAGALLPERHTVITPSWPAQAAMGTVASRVTTGMESPPDACAKLTQADITSRQPAKQPFRAGQSQCIVFMRKAFLSSNLLAQSPLSIRAQSGEKVKAYDNALPGWDVRRKCERRGSLLDMRAAACDARACLVEC